MNAQTILFLAAAIVSSSVLAQQHGRDSVYARPDMGMTTGSHSQATAAARSGRGSVFAYDLPAPSAKRSYAGVVQKFGRA